MEPGPPQDRLVRRSCSSRGFVRHDCFILAALILVALALVLPRLAHGDWKGALVSLLLLVGAVGAVVGCLLFIGWMAQLLEEPGTGWRGRAVGLLGHLLRFLLCGLIGAVLASGLAANHRLGAQGQNVAGALGGLLAGALGVALYRRLGGARFWPSFGKFAFALLGSFFGAIFGLLGPEPWSVDLGVGVPLILFAILALMGWVVPKPADGPPGSEGRPAPPPGDGL